MGMFDYFIVLDPNIRKQLTCVNKHTITDTQGFQTKDLECLMYEYYLKEDGLFCKKLHWGYENKEETEEKVPYTGQIRFYGHCEQCPKFYWENKNGKKSIFGPMPSQLWNEYIVLIHNSKAIVVETIEIETEEKHKSKMKEYWIEVNKP